MIFVDNHPNVMTTYQAQTAFSAGRRFQEREGTSNGRPSPGTAKLCDGSMTELYTLVSKRGVGCRHSYTGCVSTSWEESEYQDQLSDEDKQLYK